MGSCPYCQSVTYPGDTICYSCGRVLANTRSKTFAMEQQFNQGSADTTYKMTNRPTGRGVIQTHTGRSKNIMKRTRNKSRMIVMVFFIAFVFTSPAVQEMSLAKFASIKETVMLQAMPAREYPLETEYTGSKTISAEAVGGDGTLLENLIVPSDVLSLDGSSTMFSYTDGTESVDSSTLQKINKITIKIDQEEFNVPLNALPVKSVADKLVTTNGHEIWWPGYGTGNDYCSVSSCVKVKLNLQYGETSTIVYKVSLTSTAYSWWDNGRVDSRIDGSDMGISVENSGTFDDVIQRDVSGESQTYLTPNKKWYDAGTPGVMDSRSQGGWRVNGQDDTITTASNIISQSLPEGESENAYAYARAAFDYMHKHVEYVKGIDFPRSGPECLSSGMGDCDEQTNAFLSLLRVKGLPGWYAFGALTGLDFEEWEAHAWGYIQLPLSEEYCNENKIVLDECYVQGSVDVNNNRWLLHTPTAYIAWIEQPDPSGDLLNAYFHPSLSSSTIKRLPPMYTTDGDHDSKGGVFRVPVVAENLG